LPPGLPKNTTRAWGAFYNDGFVSVVAFYGNGRRVNPLDPDAKAACIEAAKRLLRTEEEG
jgi:hypothetical protein